MSKELQSEILTFGLHDADLYCLISQSMWHGELSGLTAICVNNNNWKLLAKPVHFPVHPTCSLFLVHVENLKLPMIFILLSVWTKPGLNLCRYKLPLPWGMAQIMSFAIIPRWKPGGQCCVAKAGSTISKSQTLGE